MVQQKVDLWRKGRTTIIISHRLSTIDNAHIIYVFKDGSVAEQGTFEQLLQKEGVFAGLVYAQQRKHAGFAVYEIASN